MKGIVSLFLLFNIGNVVAENTIIAIVNSAIITSNSITSQLLTDNSNQRKIDIINNKIDTILQIEKAKRLNIQATLKDINLALFAIAKSNNISLAQLKSYPEFPTLELEIFEKISILNLQKYITKDITIAENEAISICSKENSNSIKQIKIAQIIISEVETQNDQDTAIKAFLKKLSKHIGKGASFEGFAKLHSQHSSYLNGGITDWIEVNNPTVAMLDSLKDNEVSKIYLTDFGFAIGIKLEERFVSSNLKQCTDKLIYLKAEKFYSNWVNKLREQAFIKIYHDVL